MNRYGQMALDYHRAYLPRALAQIPDPERFFAEAGVQIAEAIGEMHNQLLWSEQPDLSPQEQQARSSQAWRTAEELVLADHHLLTAPPEDDDTPAPTGEDPQLEAYYRDLAEVNEAIARI